MPKTIVPNTESTKYNGFYIEAGAGDGEIISNSLYFEVNYKVICENNILKYVPKIRMCFYKRCWKLYFFSGQDY